MYLLRFSSHLLLLGGGSQYLAIIQLYNLRPIQLPRTRRLPSQKFRRLILPFLKRRNPAHLPIAQPRPCQPPRVLPPPPPRKSPNASQKQQRKSHDTNSDPYLRPRPYSSTPTAACARSTLSRRTRSLADPLTRRLRSARRARILEIRALPPHTNAIRINPEPGARLPDIGAAGAPHRRHGQRVGLRVWRQRAEVRGVDVAEEGLDLRGLADVGGGAAEAVGLGDGAGGEEGRGGDGVARGADAGGEVLGGGGPAWGVAGGGGGGEGVVGGPEGEVPVSGWDGGGG